MTERVEIGYNPNLSGPVMSMFCDVGPLIYPHPEEDRIEEIFMIFEEIFGEPSSEGPEFHEVDEMQSRIDAAIEQLNGPREIMLLGVMVFAAHLQTRMVRMSDIQQVVGSLLEMPKRSEFSPEIT